MKPEDFWVNVKENYWNQLVNQCNVPLEKKLIAIEDPPIEVYWHNNGVPFFMSDEYFMIHKEYINDDEIDINGHKQFYRYYYNARLVNLN